MILKKYLIFSLLFVVFSFSCCKEGTPEPTFTFDDQILLEGSEQNVVFGHLTIPQIIVNQESWLCAHLDDGNNNPDFSSSLVYSTLLSKGENNNVRIPISDPTVTFSNSQTIWLVLHESTDSSDFEFNENPAKDPILFKNGQPVAEMIEIKLPSIKMKNNENLDSIFFINRLQSTASSSFLLISKTNPNDDPVEFIVDSLATYHIGSAKLIENMEIVFLMSNSLIEGDTIYAGIVWDSNENYYCEHFRDLAELSLLTPPFVCDTIIVQ